MASVEALNSSVTGTLMLLSMNEMFKVSCDLIFLTIKMQFHLGYSGERDLSLSRLPSGMRGYCCAAMWERLLNKFAHGSHAKLC